jgi:hypothetical protein
MTMREGFFLVGLKVTTPDARFTWGTWFPKYGNQSKSGPNMTSMWQLSKNPISSVYRRISERETHAVHVRTPCASALCRQSS